MIEERFCRAALLLGEDSVKILESSHVMVCGLGAVGSYALEALARLGVGRFTLVDFDEIRPSNTNRQLLALESTIGQRKAVVAARRVLDINPNCCVEALQIFIDPDSVRDIFGSKFALRPHLVIDAIDSLSSKVELLAYCRSHDQPVISSMGAALRRDPFKLRRGTIEDVRTCALARHVRKRLRRRGVSPNIPCIYSDEPLPAKTSIAPPDTISSHDHLASRGRRRNVLGSLSTVTGMFGLLLGHMALDSLLHSTHEQHLNVESLVVAK